MKGESELTAGVARVDITPPIGQRMQGVVRRIEASEGIETPLTATALVIDDGSTKAVILDCDLLGFDVPRCASLRRELGAVVGVGSGHVLLGTTHTHTGPITFITSGLGITDWGSEFDDDRATIQAYLLNLSGQLAGVVRAANGNRQPVRAGSETGFAAGAVNREERLASGRTVLGRNPTGVSDHRVEVLRLDRLDGRPLAILTGYAAHPVVMGWNVRLLSPDYPGVVRRVVEQTTGATCLFMTGAAGNQATSEFLQDDWSEMTRIGAQIGCAVSQAAMAIETRSYHVERQLDASLSSLAMYRKIFDEHPASPPFSVATRSVSVPYDRLPTREELQAKLEAAQSRVNELRSTGAPLGRVYALLMTQHWAQAELNKLATGTRADEMTFDIAGFRLGDFAAVGMPGEPFVEIGLAVKERSRARQTLFCGYSTGLQAYWPDPTTVSDGTAMSVTSAIVTHGISAPPCKENHQIICDAFDALLTDLGI